MGEHVSTCVLCAVLRVRTSLCIPAYSRDPGSPSTPNTPAAQEVAAPKTDFSISFSILIYFRNCAVLLTEGYAIVGCDLGLYICLVESVEFVELVDGWRLVSHEQKRRDDYTHRRAAHGEGYDQRRETDPPWRTYTHGQRDHKHVVHASKDKVQHNSLEDCL